MSYNAQDKLGEVVYMELAAKGKKLAKGGIFSLFIFNFNSFNRDFNFQMLFVHQKVLKQLVNATCLYLVQ